MSDTTTRVGPDPRISRRRRAVERTRRRRMWTRFATIATAAAITWAAFFSPLFAVHHVRVVGGRHVTGAAVARAAGISSRENLLRLSTSDVAAAARTLPWVKKATVQRVLPGTLKVHVVERKPVMVLSLGAARWTVDAHGYVLQPVERALGLPQLDAVQVANVSPGTHLATPEVRGALAAYQHLPKPLQKQVTAVFSPTTERITMALTSGVAVRYGAPEQMRAKGAVLKAILAHLRAAGSLPGYIDVRVPSSPAVGADQAGEATAGPVPTPTPTP